MKPILGILTLSLVSLCECIPAGAGEQPLEPGQLSFKDCAECPEMVVIPAGSFAMGSPHAEPGRQQRHVALRVIPTQLITGWRSRPQPWSSTCGTQSP
jgi:formylglycine-generating enzyme required for sulfatase activity